MVRGLEIIKSRNDRFLLQFSGQGNPYFQDLRNLFHEDRLLLEDFFEATFEAIAEQFHSPENQHPDWYYDQFRLKEWLTNDDHFAKLENGLSHDILYSAPLVFAYQVMNVIRLDRLGMTHREILAHTAAIVGHSLGLNAALFIAQSFSSSSMEEKLAIFRKNVAILFWLGYRSKQHYLRQDNASFPFADGSSPMLIVRGKKSIVQEKIDKFHQEQRIAEQDFLVVGLENMDQVQVVCGVRLLVSKFRDWLLGSSIERGLEFLSTSCPFHTPLHNDSSELLYQDHQRIKFKLQGSALVTPVICNYDGSNLQEKKDLSHYLAKVSLVQPLNWPLVMKSVAQISAGGKEKTARTSSAITHSLNFGPSTMLQKLAERLLLGEGMQHISLISRENQNKFVADPPARKRSWRSYAPRIDKEKKRIINAYTEFTAYPPIFGGGMTPSTVEIDLSLVAANSGRLVEWAGGGQVTAEMLINRLDRLREGLQPGTGIVLNLLYLDAYLWNLQNPLVVKLKKAGYPLDGITISAGIPDTDEALQILSEYEKVGLWLNSLKPGTTKQIQSVLRIAQADKTRKIIMQIEGGAAGGHHSWEQLDQLIAENYARIRKQENIILAVGGGIATPEDAYRYLSGEWNQEIRQPVDAVILGTRLMACKETHTNAAIKQALIEIKGAPHFMRGKDGTDMGGIISGKSGLGANIHYANNHWARTSAWLEKILKGKKTAEAQQIISENEQKIIDALNQTPKPYFGQITQMTYGKVLERFVELTCPGKRLRSSEGAWPDEPFIDISYRRRLLELLQRFEDRFAGEQSYLESRTITQLTELQNPHEALARLFENYPQMLVQRVLLQDEYFFMSVCMQAGKPVNFIPILDENILKWYRSDTLWYAHCENISADSCAWIPGPLAVRGITQKNESVIDVFSKFESFLIGKCAKVDSLPSSLAAFDESSISHVQDNLIRAYGSQESLKQRSSLQTEIQLKSFDDDWWSALLALCCGPLGIYLQAPFIVQEKKSKVPNDIRATLESIVKLENVIIRWSRKGSAKGQIERLEFLLDPADQEGSNSNDPRRIIQISDNGDQSISVEYFFDVPYLQKSPLAFTRRFIREERLYGWIILEEREDYGRRVNQFYSQLWQTTGDQQRKYKNQVEGKNGKEQKFFTLEDPIFFKREQYHLLMRALNLREGGSDLSTDQVLSTFSVVLIWKNMLSTLLQSFPEDNVLDLLHLEHETVWESSYFEMLTALLSQSNSQPVGSEKSFASARSWVKKIKVRETGKEVTIAGELRKEKKRLLSFSSTFFIQGNFRDDAIQEYLYENEQTQYSIQVMDLTQKQYLLTIPGLTIDPKYAKGDFLLKETLSVQTQIRQDVYWKDERGDFIFQAALKNSQGEIIGSIESIQEIASEKINTEWRGQLNLISPKLELLQQNDNSSLEKPTNRVLSDEYTCPQTMTQYAAGSLDFNPIHTEPHFAILANLKAPIVHGLYNYNEILKVVISQLLDGDEKRIQSFKARFTEKVDLATKIMVEGHMQGHRAGKWNLQVQANVLADAGKTIATGEISGRYPLTAYFYTGQGSQFKGMGMDSYGEVPMYRQIWDEAEQVCNERLGFSLLKIVRDNPQYLRVKGQDYFHPDGVLNLTQFTQVAIIVKSLADWRILQERQLVPKQYYYGGHSLGEYAAVASQGIMSLGGVVSLVFSRGKTMQDYVERDERGQSAYAMSVVLGLKKINLDEKQIARFVAEARKESKELLEIVNYNIRDRQYSVTGTIHALEILENKLQKETGGHRTFIRLKGIDVPFHSSHLLKGVEPFRQLLQDTLSHEGDYSRLEQGYIPNLVALPFAMTKDFLQAVYEKSQSSIVRDMQKLSDAELQKDENRRKLLIELLCYQFAKPVLWIQTQELLFREKGVRRVIEIGPRGDLAGMARQTIKGLTGLPSIEVYHLDENRADVYGSSKNVLSLTEKNKRKQTVPSVKKENKKQDPPIVAEKTAVVKGADNDAVERDQVAAVQPSPIADSATPIDDRYPTIQDGLFVFLATKAQLRLDEISPGETIENLFQGNSSKRNQALADLSAEFSTSSLDGVQEKTLSDLIVSLSEMTSYDRSGPFLRTASEDFIKSKMPAGFGRSEIFQYFQQERMLGEGHCLSLSMYLPIFARSGKSLGKGELSKIGLTKRLETVDKAKLWLDKTIDQYGGIIGVKIPSRASQASTDSQQGGLISNTALLELEAKYFGVDGSVAQLLYYGQQLFSQQDPFERFKQADLENLKLRQEEAKMASWWEKDHGKDYAQKNRSLFDAHKVVWLQNSWQWAKKNLIKNFWQLANKKKSTSSDRILQQLVSHAQDAKKDIVNAHLDFYYQLAKKKKYENARQWLDEIKNTIIRASSAAKKNSQDMFTLFVPGKEEGPFCGQLQLADGQLKFTENQVNDYRFKDGQWAKRLFTDHLIRLEDQAIVEGDKTRDQGNNVANSQNENWQSILHRLFMEGINLQGKSFLITGAGKNSIALELVKYLLRAGAKVALGTSSYSEERLKFYKRVYQNNAALDAQLCVVPFSQASLEDCQNLVKTAFAAGLEVDCLIPFGAVAEENSLLGINVESTSTFRVMLLGIHSMIAEMSREYRARFISHKRFHVLLPLSPNHGSFGRDGLYAEMKLALEALLEKWHSENEDWGRHCYIVGCRIGWVRGTGLMELNDIVAPELEETTDCKTFHRKEIALLLLSLIEWSSIHNSGAVVANLSGKLDQIRDLKIRLTKIRHKILAKVNIQRKLKLMQSKKSINEKRNSTIEPLANVNNGSFPTIPDAQRLRDLGDLSDLERSRVICLVGFGEVGPCGSARTRWDLEKHGLLSLEGAVELAWIMGFIESKREHWIDKETKEKIADWHVKEKYEEMILAHSGIRIVEAEVNQFDPRNFPAFTDVVLEEDFIIPMINQDEAYRCQIAEPDKTQVYFDEKKDKWFIRRKKGTIIKVKKSMSLERFVAGQIPTGWDPEIYGVERSLIEQVDQTSLYAILATCEAFVQAGIEPIEIYRYLHPAEVGSTLGGGMGGMQKLKRMFQDHRLDQKRQHDVLQETLINVTVAWAVTSLLGSVGPIQTPVAACATAGISVELALSLLEQKKARFVIAGGFDDLGEEGMLGFGDMDATANNVEMEKKGIVPRRMSRPNDVRRAGFIESQGGGVVLLATADLVLEMGLPIWGIIPYVASHTDGIQASIPAPGLGLVSVAREDQTNQGANSPDDELLSISTRRTIFQEIIKSKVFASDQLKSKMREQIFHDYWKGNAKISPLKGALSVYGLSVNDLDIVYKHDTSTNANDPNECRLHNEIQRQLGRDKGNPLLVSSQKSLTGHSKGGAASWQLHGLVQSLNEGVYPPNFSLDDVDKQMDEYEYLAFTDELIQVGKHRLKGGMVTSLGFGHVGVLIVVLHPDFFFTLLNENEKKEYIQRRTTREHYSQQRIHNMKLGVPLYQRRKESIIGDVDEEVKFYLDSTARIQTET